jgi:hypothetical protein
MRKPALKELALQRGCLSACPGTFLRRRQARAGALRLRSPASRDREGGRPNGIQHILDTLSLILSMFDDISVFDSKHASNFTDPNCKVLGYQLVRVLKVRTMMILREAGLGVKKKKKSGRLKDT